MNIKKGAVGLVIGMALFALPAFADTTWVNFESPTYSAGSINGQDGWMSLGSIGSGCAVYDQAVAAQSFYPAFGAQSFRISDAVTSGCFGDQTFAKPLVNSVGETAATVGTFSDGVRQTTSSKRTTNTNPPRIEYVRRIDAAMSPLTLRRLSGFHHKDA